MLKVLSSRIVYHDQRYYSSFPGLAATGDGKLIAVFRRAPNYNGLPGIPKGFRCHGDITSQLMSVTSADSGESWSAPELVWAPPEGGSQDGGLFYDGKYLYANSFTWRFVPGKTAEALKECGQDEYLHDYMTFMVPHGSYVMRSEDCGGSWDGPFMPEPLPGDREVLPGVPLQLHNRGNICRLPDGRLLLTGQILGNRPEFHSSVGIYQSSDNGKSWQYLVTPAEDHGVAVFEEPFLYVTDSGKWVMLIRCHRSVTGERFESAQLFVTESFDGGKSWSVPYNTGVHAEPPSACRLQDGSVLVVYGYRQEPYGVRARICDSELCNISSAKEYIIRDDAGQGDTGYPAAVPIGDNRYLVVYYINHPSYNGAAAIESSIITILDEQ